MLETKEHRDLVDDHKGRSPWLRAFNNDSRWDDNIF